MTQDQTQAQESQPQRTTLEIFRGLSEEEQVAVLCQHLRPGTDEWVELGCGPAGTPVPTKRVRR